jgi:hypothetical protein
MSWYERIRKSLLVQSWYRRILFQLPPLFLCNRWLAIEYITCFGSTNLRRPYFAQDDKQTLFLNIFKIYINSCKFYVNSHESMLIPINSYEFLQFGAQSHRPRGPNNLKTLMAPYIRIASSCHQPVIMSFENSQYSLVKMSFKNPLANSYSMLFLQWRKLWNNQGSKGIYRLALPYDLCIFAVKEAVK